MQTLTHTKSTPLLEVVLEVLHEQSNEWMSDIAFWWDEVGFLYTLVVNKTLYVVPVNAKNAIEKIQEELLKITGGELNDLQKEVEEHELVLSHLLESEYENTDSYRQKHSQLALKIGQFEKRLKSLKKEIFALVEHIKKDLVKANEAENNF